MTAPTATSLADLVVLAHRSAEQLDEALSGVTDADLERPTPCTEWDLRTLVLHVADSADALSRLLVTGTMEGAAGERPQVDVVTLTLDRVRHLIAGLDEAAGRSPSDASDERIGWAIGAAQAGAIEFAAHGWDVARALGSDRGLPSGHAEELLALSRSLIPADESRPPVFGPSVEPAPTAPTADRFAAYLGRPRFP